MSVSAKNNSENELASSVTAEARPPSVGGTLSSQLLPLVSALAISAVVLWFAGGASILFPQPDRGTATTTNGARTVASGEAKTGDVVTRSLTPPRDEMPSKNRQESRRASARPIEVKTPVRPSTNTAQRKPEPAALAANERDIIVGGANPSVRPNGAPTISEMKKDGDWFAEALVGLTKPYPKSFEFLEDQGPWYTPFNRRGMTGPYDIRRWHDESR
jgi:hypothetical protein